MSSRVISENNVESVPPIPVRTTSLIAFQRRWPSGNYEHSQRWLRVDSGLHGNWCGAGI